MKICYIASGRSIHTQRWINAFAELEYEISLISPVPISKNIDRRVNIFDLSNLKGSKMGYFNLVHKVRKLVREIQPDILHAHYASSCGFISNCCNYHPLIISVWGSDVFDFPRKSWLHRSILKSNLKAADVVLSTSHMMAVETQKYLPNNDKPLYITPFGVDTTLFSPVDRVDKTQHVTIGVIKTLEKIYGIDILIEAFSLLCQKYSNIKLLIIGNGSELSSLQQQLKMLQIVDKVDILPAISHHLVPGYLAKIDIFVMPSRQESFGVAVLEASACGLPIVASNVGGLPEVIEDSVTGFLVPPDRPQDLAKKISQLIESPGLRKSMGQQGRNFVEKHYKWSDSVEKMSDIYQSLKSAAN